MDVWSVRVWITKVVKDVETLISGRSVKFLM